MNLSQWVLLLLSLSVALNLYLTFRILRRLDEPPQIPELLPTVPGGPLAAVIGKSLQGTKLALGQEGKASALLFLSSQCPKCREKLPQITELAELAEPAGLQLWLVSTESSARLRRFLASTPLLSRVVRVAARQHKRLNPTLSSPFYLFVDHLGQLEAGGHIGDENWQSFAEQMQQIRQELAASS
ncbi:MAG: redoxin domain-containing protein [Pseudomonadota bacterium]|uniref:TlpA family protein disulfide reductase n=1 Tax=Gallaecimonas pentaromativorans TaxID=584787 RepID=UPI00067EAB06|nr:redoxin domain-containing protein [Gallaecimonas pentaromativorans]MED5523264.1 redoxin domain-containing protein [Pseudomonadota bacterium]